MIRFACTAIAATIATVSAFLAPAHADTVFSALRKPPADAQIITLYTARHYDADKALYEQFQAKTGIQVKVVQAKPELLIERLKAEGKGSAADVVLMADAVSLQRTKDAGLLQPLASKTINSRIPAHLRDVDDRWAGLAYRARVIFYRKGAVQRRDIASYADLTDAKLRGKVCVRPGDNPYNLSLVSALIARWGLDDTQRWAKGLVANFARPPQGNDTDQLRALVNGPCQVAIANSYYYLRLLRSDTPKDRDLARQIGVVFPDQRGDGAHINITGGGIATYAPNPDAARAFLAFLTTDSAQRIFAEANNEYPAVRGAPMPEAVRIFSRFAADRTPVADITRHGATAQSVVDAAAWR